MNEAKRAIAELHTAMQTVIGWIEQMDADELEHLAEGCRRMAAIAVNRLMVVRAASADVVLDECTREPPK